MRRPAFYALLLFVLGILLGNFFDLPTLLLLSVLALTLLYCVLFLLLKEKGSVRFFLILSIILAGFFRYELVTRNFPPNHVSNFLSLNSRATITGKIVDEPDVRKNKTFITLGTERIFTGNRTYSTTGQIILKIKEPTYKFDYADNIEFKGYLSHPMPKRNPGAFDYKNYLNRKNIYGIVSLSRAEQVAILKGSTGDIFLSKIIIPLRRWILDIFDKTLSGDHKALLAGFLLGETREIPTRVYTMFRDTGTVHLLAVSGSNVWLVIGVIFGALSLLRVPKLFATIFTLICIFIFANLVHNDPPVVRAGIMAGVVLLGVLLYKDVDLINLVSFSGLVILSVSPLFLFDVGFQLSFASVFAILLVYPELSKLVSKYVSRSRRNLWKWIIIPALISISVELVLFPILAYYFNLIPLVIVVANIFIVPLAGISVVLACFTLFLAIFSTSFAGILSASNWLCLDLTLRLTEFFANLPIAKLTVPAPSISTFILYYFFLWLLVSSIGSKKKAILFSGLIIANLLIWKDGFTQGNKPLGITFLDVSQGSSVFVRLPNDQTFLINAGEKGKGFDAGEYVVIPFLNHEGATRIDKLILTDTDTLNLNSAGTLLKEIEFKHILVSNPLPFGEENWRDFTKKNSNKLTFLEELENITDTKDKLEIRFFEYPETYETMSASVKMLTKIRYKSISFCLFDGMKKVYFNPEFEWKELKNCSVLVLPELGNVDEITQIITAVEPQKIIFTRHYFRYEKDKIPALMSTEFPDIEYYRTVESGAIICQTRGEKIKIQTTLQSGL